MERIVDISVRRARSRSSSRRHTPRRKDMDSIDEGVRKVRERDRWRGRGHKDMASSDVDSMWNEGVNMVGGTERRRSQSTKEEHRTDQGLSEGQSLRRGVGQQGGPAQRSASLSLSNLSSPRRVPALTFPGTEDAREQGAAHRCCNMCHARRVMRAAHHTSPVTIHRVMYGVWCMMCDV